MPTLTIQIVSGLGTTNLTKTFSSADAQRILSGFQKQSGNPNASQLDLGNHLMDAAIRFFDSGINVNETVMTLPPPVNYT